MRLLYSVFSLILLSLVLTLARPPWREAVQKWYWEDDRQVLAVLDLAIKDQSGPDFIKVIKVKEAGLLYLEFYRISISHQLDGALGADSQIEKIQKVKLANTFDGYFTVGDQVTNLAAINIDSDEQLEVLIPSFNRDLVASLDVAKYNPANRRFDILDVLVEPIVKPNFSRE